MRWEFRLELGTPADRTFRAFASEALVDGSAWRAWVAEHDHRLVGCLWIQLVQKVPHPSRARWDRPVAYLTNMYVAPGHRDAGLGRGLLDEAFAFARARGVDGVFLWQGVCYQSIRLRNYGLAPAMVDFEIRFAADYADIFEVRGQRRPRRGRLLRPETARNGVVLGYEGRDGVVRRTRIECDPHPTEVTSSEMRFSVRLDPHHESTLYLTAACETAGRFADAVQLLDSASRKNPASGPIWVALARVSLIQQIELSTEERNWQLFDRAVSKARETGANQA